MSVISLADAKAYLEIGHTAQDGAIQIMLDGAESFAAEFCGVALSSANRSEDLDGGAALLRPKHLPVTTLTSVTDLWNSTAWPAALFSDALVARADSAGRILVAGQGANPWKASREGWWPEGVKRWRVAYVGGHATLPAGLKLAILQLTRRAYFNRGGEAQSGAAGVSVSWLGLLAGPIGEMLQPFKRRRVLGTW